MTEPARKATIVTLLVVFLTAIWVSSIVLFATANNVVGSITAVLFPIVCGIVWALWMAAHQYFKEQ